MTLNVKLEQEKLMKVQIENGKIMQIEYKGRTGRKIATREEKDYIQMWLEVILKENLEEFKIIMLEIKDDKEFFEYGKILLEKEKNKKQNILEQIRQEFEKEIAKREQEVRRYELSLEKFTG